MRQSNTDNHDVLLKSVARVPTTDSVTCREEVYHPSVPQVDLELQRKQTSQRLQAFPGQFLPPQPERTLFPVPDRVGEYCSRDEFQKYPKYAAQWVHWKDRVEKILSGQYHDIYPVHFEGIFTLLCNFKCPHCTRREARSRWTLSNTWDGKAHVDKTNTMHLLDLKRTLDQVASMRVDDQMGIVWGGGDPTANPFTYDALLYARSLGITSSFITNGVFLDPVRLLEAQPVLIRISLNCGSEATYRSFHGYPAEYDYYHRVRRSLRNLVREKLAQQSRTLIGLSIIVDERNLTDLALAAEEIRLVVEDAGPGIDYVITRPVLDYAHFSSPRAELQANTKEQAFHMLTEGGTFYNVMCRLGIPLILIKDSFAPPPDDSLYGDSRCLAYSMCGEIRHNGDVQICSDSYGNPEYTIGNVLHNSLSEIWASDRRKQVVDTIHRRQCYRTTCPYNSRGHHLNRIFHQVEAMRCQGRMDEVLQWVKDLRECLYPLGHSFFL